MFNRVFILINSLEVVSSSPQAYNTQDVCFTYVIDVNDPRSITDLTSFYYHHEGPCMKFNIGIKGIISKKGKELNDIVVLLSHPSYLCDENGINMFLFNKDKENNQPIIEDFLTDQGYKKQNIIPLDEFIYTPSEPTVWHISNQKTKAIKEKAAFECYYKNYINHNYSYRDFFIIKEYNEVLPDKTLLWLKEIKNGINRDNPYIGSLIQQLYDYTKENGKLTELVTARERELNIMNELFLENAKKWGNFLLTRWRSP